jgi:hypothetical protein
VNVRCTIVSLSALALPLFAAPTAANAQYTEAVARCISQNPDSAGKACCSKIYAGYVSNQDRARLADEVKACVYPSSSKDPARKK